MTGITRRGLLRWSAAIPVSSMVAKLVWPRTLADSVDTERRLVLLEAESFVSTGGWAIDQEFADQMGSSMLLAHGMGTPVTDAVTSVEIPEAGRYRVWARTRDWAAPWNATSAPGRFQVEVNGKFLSTIFGTEGARWHWQDGGTVKLAAGKAKVALHDLTGFDGRCDAILFASDPGWQPPDDGPELVALRRRALKIADEPEDGGKFDLVVAGGGMAGCTTAITAARMGLKVALIQDRPVLGGNSSSEVRVSPAGLINLPPYPALGKIVSELDPGHKGNAQPAANYGDEQKLAVVKAESNIRLFLSMHIFAVEKNGQRITAVLGREEKTCHELRFRAPFFVDCTGDATVGFLAGAESRYGRESRAETGEGLAPEVADRLVNGTSVMWYSEDAGVPAPFPLTPWALAFTEESVQNATRGDWDWETGQLKDQIAEFETVRDHALRAIYGNWSFQKNSSVSKERYRNLQLAWVGYVGGKRESRRLMGDVVLQQQDVIEQRLYPDACVTATWPIDLHEPTAKNAADFPGQEFRAVAHQIKKPNYAIPYRCLYSRNIDNLFMAGRNISVTHVALGTVRVQRTTGMMGEVVGMAAAIASRRGTTPRGVYENYLPELIAAMTRGAGGSVPANVHNYS
ncbi:MAG: FAD-dependent oxidoreductase [Acidobacteriaceae bacterium]|nr:FAD-dependent oxidoreductase [Acidobacteriaceae bacterium]